MLCGRCLNQLVAEHTSALRAAVRCAMNRSGCRGHRINKRMVGSELVHLQTADTDRIYFLAAVLAYLLRRVDPRSRFPSDFRTLIG